MRWQYGKWLVLQVKGNTTTFGGSDDEPYAVPQVIDHQNRSKSDTPTTLHAPDMMSEPIGLL